MMTLKDVCCKKTVWRRSGEKKDHGYGNHERCGCICAEGGSLWRSGGSDSERVRTFPAESGRRDDTCRVIRSQDQNIR